VPPLPYRPFYKLAAPEASEYRDFWLQHQPRDLTAGWTADWFTNCETLKGPGTQFLPYMGALVWTVEHVWLFYGRVIPLARNARDDLFIFKVGELLFLYSEETDQGFVLHPALSLNDFMDRYTHPETPFTELADGINFDHSPIYWYEGLENYYFWERMTQNRDRIQELIARGGNVDSSWLVDVAPKEWY